MISIDRVIWEKASHQARTKALARPEQSTDQSVTLKVAEIVRSVKDRGDEALHHLNQTLDGVTRSDFREDVEHLAKAASEIDPDLYQAMIVAKTNLETFHEAQKPKDCHVRIGPGIDCSLYWRPVEKVGLYIPAGTAPLFSSVLMQAVPAKIAGCSEIILCSPPQADGKIAPAILAAAHLCGLEKVFAIGGAQAIAAMAYGTTTIPKVYKIFGPGNAYVTAAKFLVSQDSDGAAIDMPAGPSEVMVLADNASRPELVAADLLAQAEHDANAHVVLVAENASLLPKVLQALDDQLQHLPRYEIAKQALAKGVLIQSPDRKTSLDIINLYAPEHLILHVADPQSCLPDIANAGSVFLGEMTPESAGDYASGTNHVLPTFGHARAYGGLSVYSFLKTMTAQSLTGSGLKNLSETLITLAKAEGLLAHAEAVSLRLRLL